ncbi:MAG: hypothetical protein A3B23_00975 [Candidatus Colwellbacteria bacterium RIFCSPLOWO2_01_FULL_48_10]|uniref:Transposase DDE domain-containing protein n=2 Tax=Bacteria candidate phyla TaxID=1783234 RepID=A0A1F5P2P7_9BACT|nr:MAG: hypothetical protein A2846_04015 [Candidatus Doudnabacteria bacterium RIFCSPHIGHO2_01_FULL_49_9]OGY59516.1 MAG: hypothetical protein A3B23_00975 [Candidatus Colwellbacteria bacterium RIFCSPLOWO2_01_FULL_48_10]
MGNGKSQKNSEKHSIYKKRTLIEGMFGNVKQKRMVDKIALLLYNDFAELARVNLANRRG